MIILRGNFTKREREILEFIVEAQTKKPKVKDVYGYVASELILGSGTVRNTTYRLRRKYEKAMGFCEEYRDWRRKLHGSRIL